MSDNTADDIFDMPNNSVHRQPRSVIGPISDEAKASLPAGVSVLA